MVKDNDWRERVFQISETVREVGTMEMIKKRREILYISFTISWIVSDIFSNNRRNVSPAFSSLHSACGCNLASHECEPIVY